MRVRCGAQGSLSHVLSRWHLRCHLWLSDLPGEELLGWVICLWTLLPDILALIPSESQRNQPVQVFCLFCLSTSLNSGLVWFGSRFWAAGRTSERSAAMGRGRRQVRSAWPPMPSFNFIAILFISLLLLSHVRLFATPWTIVRQAPLSMGFSRQEYWSVLPFPSPGGLPNPGWNRCLLHLLPWQADSLPRCHPLR